MTITPADYHRIISPTLSVPSDPQVSVPVGLLACQRDPYLRSLETTVVSASISIPAPVAASKKTKKWTITSEILSEPLLCVLLHDTIIFPEGGGQPTDIGHITILTDDDNTFYDVFQCKRHGGHAVHYIKMRSGQNIEGALSSFSPGARVKVDLGREGYERRYDHMSIHTSQHLLSAILETRLNLPTLSWSLTSYPSPSYVELPRGMTEDEIASVQAEVNKLVFEGRKVYVEVEELEVGQITPAQKTENGRAIGKALPTDYTGGVKRVVTIDGVDRNPCCGTHLPSINNLQLFIMPHTEALSRSSTTSARLYFISGPRLIAHLTSTHGLLAITGSTLSCGASLVPERVNQILEERKRAEKRVTEAEQELAEWIARDLASRIKATVTNGKLYKVHIHRTDDTNNILGFLSFIASSTKSTITTEPAQPYIVVLSSSPSTQTAQSISTILVFGSHDSTVKSVGDALKAKLAMKGGGKGLIWSGKFTGVWKLNKENTIIEDVMDGLQA